MKRLFGFIVVALLVAFLPHALHAQIVSDTTSAAGNALSPIANSANVLIGLGVFALTKLAGAGLRGVEKGVRGVDSAAKSKLGPLLPVIAYGAAVLAPGLGIDGATFSAAPASALTAIIVNEAVSKWVAPFLSKLLKGRA